ncbi:Protein CASP [Caenorhabditis elegans]|uniref:Protein CASP n=1 Tax=Caenorhabditis elegans TaxID=6239 RepID=CASP_CAEEL|nr:Protein CASP [Caenorhabditis elegans]Q8IA98.1 RecName: Full=Protein CASP [Caenorhabditis elegans]CCD73824.1 Protein CASP [Caenorhabditis elegans]|eukprot:NP_497577.2 Protein CASP [Caenorhabditis elegans]
MEIVSRAWESVDWDRIQTRVEAEVTALGQRQDDSEIRKTRLVEESNAYRGRTNKDSRKVAIPLIKAFQSEFDGLLARSTAAENALIDICKSIVSLPDPKSLLKGAEAWKNDAEKTQKAVEEREELKRQLIKVNNELEDLRGKDVKVRKLKDKLAKLESEQDIFIENAVNEVEKKAEQELNDRLTELIAEKEKMKEQNEILEKNMDSLESKNKDIQRKLEIAKQTVEQKDGLENEQLSIAMKDLADAKHKIVFLEERVSQLENEAEKVNESKKAGNIEDIAALGSVLVQKDDVIQQLTNDIKRHEASHVEELAKWKLAVSAVEKKNKTLIGELNELKNQLESRNDYEAIKNELRLLREIEFGDSAEANAESIERLGETVETLDRLLAEKNRRLQNENASLRVANDGFKGRNEEQEAELTVLKEKSERNDRLIAQLEADLASAVQDIGIPERMGTNEMLKDAPAPTISDASLVPILTSQRNRLHERVTSLEEAISLEKTKQLSVQNEIERVREENIRLCERIRFLQSPGGQQQANVEAGLGNDFRNGNRNKKVSLHDKTTLNMGRAILATPKSRTVFFSYLLILHALIMLVLYKFAFDQSVVRDAETECEYKFHQHMLDNHKQ